MDDRELERPDGVRNRLALAKYGMGGVTSLRSAILAALLVTGAFGSQSRAGEALLLQDTYVDNGPTGSKPPPVNANFGTSNDLRVFRSGTRVGRAFLKFSLATLPPGTTAADVTQARLRLWVNESTTASGAVTLTPVTTSWDELILKDNTSASITFGQPKLSDLAISTVANFVSVDVTDWVKGWLNGTLVNEGFEIEPSATTAPNLYFDSKESDLTGHEPRLEISLNKTGSAGPTGAQGQQGSAGAAGPVGPQGLQGSQGPAGPAGIAGPGGIPGPAGSQGNTGNPGPAGATGAAGAQGSQGPAGPAAAWPTRIEPQGDLSMGEFTQGPTPAATP